MERRELENIIEDKLVKYNMPRLADCKENVKGHLIKIEDYIQGMEVRRKEIYEEYKSMKINVKVVSQNAQIARQTIYNNRDYLEKYIVCRQEEFNDSDIFANINASSDKEVIKELKETINKLYYRDLKEQFKLDEIDDLKNERNSLLKDLNAIKENNAELIKEIEFLRKKINGNNNILNIGGHNK